MGGGTHFHLCWVTQGGQSKYSSVAVSGVPTLKILPAEIYVLLHSQISVLDVFGHKWKGYKNYSTRSCITTQLTSQVFETFKILCFIEISKNFGNKIASIAHIVVIFCLVITKLSSIAHIVGNFLLSHYWVGIILCICFGYHIFYAASLCKLIKWK